MKTSRIIGITGKTGSGKTTVSKWLGEMTGFHVIHGDKYVHQLAQTTPIKQITEWRLGHKLTLSPEDKELLKTGRLYEGGNAIFCNSKMKRYEAHAALLGIDYLLSKELKELDGEPAIVELVGLPNLHSAKKLAECSFITGNSLRYQKISERDKISVEAAEKIDSFYNSVVDFNKLKYSHMFHNDYKTIPAGLEQYAEELVQQFK